MPVLQTSYTDVPDVLANLGVPFDASALVGANTQLSVDCALGATSLTVVNAPGASGTAPVVGFAYLLDGPTSERVMLTAVSGGTGGPWTLSVPVGTLAAHSAGASLSQAGPSGCLADMILRAGAKVESICHQGPDGGSRSLWQASRTESYAGPNSWRAAVMRDQTLLLRPYRFPVLSVSDVTMQVGASSPIGVSTQYLMIPDGGRLIYIPSPTILANASQPVIYANWPRATSFTAQLTYTGGPVAGTTLDSVPADIREALYLLVLDYLSYRMNQYGSVDVRRGDVNYRHAAAVRGDAGADSMFLSQARELLSPYSNTMP